MKYGFFEDDLGNKSITRIIGFGSFIVASVIALWLHNEHSLDAMIALGMGNYGIAKTNETARLFKPTQTAVS